MKQGKRKNSTAEPSAPSDVGVLPDAAYVDQLLDGAAPTEAVAAEVDAAADAVTEGVIELPAQCLLRDAVEYQQRLLKCVGTPVVIDVGAVERIDTAFIQVLLAFARNHADAKQSITWRHVNSEFAESVRLLGVQSALSVPDMSEAA